MKILLTGSRGYIGTVMAPMFLQAGHEVVGVDTDLYRRSTFGPWQEPIRTLVKDVRELEAADLEGFDAVAHLAALSNDPLGDLNPASHLRDQPPGLGAPGQAREVRRGLPVRLRLLLQQLRGCRGRARGRNLAAEPGHGVRDVQGARRAGRCRPRRRLVHAPRSCAAPPRTGCRRGCASTSCSTTWWPGPSPPGRSTSRATARPGGPIVHIEDIARAFLAVARGAGREVVHGQAFNVGRDDQNFRISGDRGDRAEHGSRVRDHLCRRRGARQAKLPRQLRQDRRVAARVPAAVGRAQGGGRSSSRPTAASG